MHWVNTVAFSVDGKILASGSEDGNLYLWDVEIGEKLKDLTEGTENIFSVVFSPDGKTLASISGGSDIYGYNSGTIFLWNVLSK